jgi:hypothetical protein
MALQLSTGLRNKLLDTSPFRTIFNLGFVKLYSGTVPASADATLTGSLVLTLSNNNTGTGLTFASAAAGGVITKTLAEVWSGTAVASATVTHYRLVTATDSGVLSTTDARVQGLVGLSAAEMILPVIALVNTTLYPLDTFSIGLPTL